MVIEYFKISSIFLVLYLAGIVNSFAEDMPYSPNGNATPYSSVFHSPFKINNESYLLFLKSNLHRNDVELKDGVNVNIPVAEIYSFSLNNKPDKALRYIINFESEKITDIFIGDSLVEKNGKTVYVIGKSKRDPNLFVYDVIELQLIPENKSVEAYYFSGDIPEPELINCLDGYSDIEKKHYVCKYKTREELKELINTKRELL